MTNDTIICVGPPMSGKTLNAKAIAEAYGCQAVYEAGSDDYAMQRATGRILVLAHSRPIDRQGRPMPGQVVTVGEARQRCGSAWIEPNRKGRL
jgi:MoxR-like ATPase